MPDGVTLPERVSVCIEDAARRVSIRGELLNLGLGLGFF